MVAEQPPLERGDGDCCLVSAHAESSAVHHTRAASAQWLLMHNLPKVFMVKLVREGTGCKRMGLTGQGCEGFRDFPDTGSYVG